MESVWKRRGGKKAPRPAVMNFGGSAGLRLRPLDGHRRLLRGRRLGRLRLDDRVLGRDRLAMPDRFENLPEVVPVLQYLVEVLRIDLFDPLAEEAVQGVLLRPLAHVADADAGLADPAYRPVDAEDELPALVLDAVVVLQDIDPGRPVGVPEVGGDASLVL